MNKMMLIFFIVLICAVAIYYRYPKCLCLLLSLYFTSDLLRLSTKTGVAPGKVAITMQVKVAMTEVNDQQKILRYSR